MNAVTLTSGMRQNLFSLQRTSRLLSINAIRLNTGKKVNSALDDPVSFFTSIQTHEQSQRFDATLLAPSVVSPHYGF